MNHLNLPAL